MNDKIFSVRLSAEEHQALKKLAAAETRTANSWIKSRIVMAARELGLLDDGKSSEMNQEDIPVEYYNPPAYEELDL